MKFYQFEVIKNCTYKGTFFLDVIDQATKNTSTGLLDVGYTRKIEDREIVVYRRNITVGVGCICRMVFKDYNRLRESLFFKELFQRRFMNRFFF